MAKLRKVKRQKKYRYNVNRKRLRNKVEQKGKIGCKEIKNAWEEHKSVRVNLRNMGLAYDPNKSIKTGTEDNQTEQVTVKRKRQPRKAYVAEALENDAKAPREKKFQLPKGQVQWITYLMDKYDTDYKAMVKDKKNYYQETWKQIKRKIEMFKNVPEQYSKYLASKTNNVNSI